MLFATTTWPEAIIWTAVIICLLGIPVLANAIQRRDGTESRDMRDLVMQQKDTLTELRALREDVAVLRSEVAELDRMLKSVG